MHMTFQHLPRTWWANPQQAEMPASLEGERATRVHSDMVTAWDHSRSAWPQDLNSEVLALDILEIYEAIPSKPILYLLLHFCYTKPCCSERWDWTHSACNNIETAIWSLKCLAQRWIHISKSKKPSRAILCSLYLVRGWGDQNGCREIPSKPTW